MIQTHHRTLVWRSLVVAMAAIMVVSIAAGAAVAQEPDDGEIADEIYVDEEGNAVLVFEDESTDDSTGELGVDMAQGLVYALITDDIEDDVSAAFDLWMDPSSVESAGEFAVDRPDELTAFDLEVATVQTDQENWMDASLHAEADLGNHPMVDTVDYASFDGTLESSVDRLESEGSYAAEWGFPTDTPAEAMAIGVAGTQGDYALSVEEVRWLAPTDVPQWETEEDAKAQLEAEFVAIAEELGGEADVTIHHHDVYQDEHDRTMLELAFDVSYTDIDGAADVIAEELAADPELDLTHAEAQIIAEAVFDVDVQGIGLSVQEDGHGMQGAWEIDLQNLAPLSHGMIDLAEATSDAEFDELGLFEQTREQLEAQEAADVVHTAEWSAELTKPQPGVLSLTADAETEATNWAAYVAELEDRGIGTSGEMTAEAHGDLVGDEIVLEFAVEFSHDDMLEEAMLAIQDGLEDDPSVTDQELAFWEGLAGADLQIAGIDVDASDGTMTITAAASYDDMSAFQGMMAEEFHDLSVVHVYGDIGDDRLYVYAHDVFDPGVTESEVRDHPAVDDDTAVHLEHDLTQLPVMDVHAAGDFLGIGVDDVHLGVADYDDEDDHDDSDPADDTSTDDVDDERVPDDADDDFIPGFGVVAAALALLGSLAILRRR